MGLSSCTILIPVFLLQSSQLAVRNTICMNNKHMPAAVCRHVRWRSKIMFITVQGSLIKLWPSPTFLKTAWSKYLRFSNGFAASPRGF